SFILYDRCGPLFMAGLAAQDQPSYLNKRSHPFMHSKTLGRTGLDVSIVGLGTAFLGMPTVDASAGSYEALVADLDDDLGVQTVHAALEAGCTLIDTAALYGGGRSEKIIGQALRARPDLAARCTVTTKV